MSTRNQELIDEYQRDLRATRAVWNGLKDKRDNYLELKKEAMRKQEWAKYLQYEELAKEYRERAQELSSIISSSQFSIDWLKQGFEPRTKVSKLPYKQREVIVSDVDQALIYLNTTKDQYIELTAEEKKELDDYLNILTPREKDVFLSIRGKGNTYQATADYLGISESATGEYMRRARQKIEKAVDEGVQTALF